MNERSTRQLTTTLEVLAASADHPTAEQVFQRVRARLPRISLGTVYRNLEKLHRQGRLRIIWLGGGVAHYDAVTAEHDHFLCEACGAVRDLVPEPPGALPADLIGAGCIVRRRTTALYGLCPECAQRAERVDPPSMASGPRPRQPPWNSPA